MFWIAWYWSYTASFSQEKHKKHVTQAAMNFLSLRLCLWPILRFIRSGLFDRLLRFVIIRRLVIVGLLIVISSRPLFRAIVSVALPVIITVVLPILPTVFPAIIFVILPVILSVPVILTIAIPIFPPLRRLLPPAPFPPLFLFSETGASVLVTAVAVVLAPFPFPLFSPLFLLAGRFFFFFLTESKRVTLSCPRISWASRFGGCGFVSASRDIGFMPFLFMLMTSKARLAGIVIRLAANDLSVE